MARVKARPERRWRRNAAAMAMAAVVGLGPLVALAAQTQIFDPQTRTWVDYDARKARQYYARNKQVPDAFRRQVVPFRTAEQPGTIIIDGNQHFLYLIQPGGPDNPLGARALYLYEGDNDTIYRIHGTPESWSIGLDVSSGCIRMNNDDIIDLHSRIKIGAKVIVLMQGAALYKGV
jgi:lipoprotein-anchoring transpeptidase ErfK/SrfK